MNPAEVGRAAMLEAQRQARAREMLKQAAIARGKVFTRSRPAHPSNMGQPHECWTNAWALARQAGLKYFEGVVTLPSGRVDTHAWTRDRKGRVIEPTPGYEDAVSYAGFEVPKELALKLSGAWSGWRSSVLEVMAAMAYDDHDPMCRALFVKLTGTDRAAGRVLKIAF